MDHLLAPSSSSNVLGIHDHDVFLSFRGEDTRNNFTGHLYRALQHKGIQTFIDNELKRGEEISPSLIKAIRGSKISIIIFSKNYASSSWCLDELVEILECRESLGQLVLPIFFDVDPSEVRNHTRSFGEAIAKYEETSNKKKEKLPKWKVALNKASNLSGWALDKGDESQLIQRIVEAALSKLNRILLYVAKYPVGIECYLQKLGPLIDIAEKDVRFIGVNGIGGIGKTTIAKAVFNKFADEFEGSSFLPDVRETSKQHLGMVKLQEMLLYDMLGDKNIKVGNIHRGINIIRDRLCQKRVLLVLDDVDDQDQLEILAGGHEWFGLGSRIIITTRNKHLLTTHEADGIYEVQGLSHKKALELLSWNAFKREKPVDENYLTLSNRIVHYASGLPLALVLLGSFMCGRTEDQWQSAIHNLEKKPDDKLYEILKLSYDALREDEKALFLDIACFFVGEDTDYVIKVLGSSNFCPIMGIRILSDMSLINVEDKKLRMHNLIEEMGKEIVRRESPHEAGKRSRLWCPDEVFHIFSENTGTNLIQGIMLKFPEQRTLYLNAKTFKKMKRLRLLIFANVVLSTAIGYLPDELRLIDLPGYQFSTLPFNSGPKQLVVLNMPHNHIHQLDKGFKNFERLKVLNFNHSKFLRKIPDLSTAPNLESLYVDHCASLVEIHESVGFLTKLVTLDAQHCSNLSTVPSNLVSKYFTTLDFQGCSRLQIFPNLVEKIEFLRNLDLSGTEIKELPSSIDRIVKLEHLRLSDCKKLVHIPSSIYKLAFLYFLGLNGCTNLSKFPDYVQEIHGTFKLSVLILANCNISDEDFLVTPFNFPFLYWLDLSDNKFVRLPSVRKLTSLVRLSLANCRRLREIPELPEHQANLIASDCKSLVDTPWKIMAKIISGGKQGFLRDSEIKIALPGSDIPDWFSHKSVTNSVTFDVPLNMMKNVAAVIICAVSRSRNTQRLGFAFELLHESYTGRKKSSKQTVEWPPKLVGESDSCDGSFGRPIEIGAGNMSLIYLPASTILFECMSFSPFGNTKISVLKKLNHFNKIKVSIVDNYSCISRCGIHVLWDEDEIMIEGKPIKVSDSISHAIDRTFDYFGTGGNQFSSSSHQNGASVSAMKNIFETEDLEKEEEVTNISEIEDMEEEEVTNIFETESIEEEEELANIFETEDMEEVITKSDLWMHWLKTIPVQKKESVSARTNIFEIEDSEEEEEVANISETEDMEEEELANIFETEDMEELITKSVLLMQWLKKIPLQKRASVSTMTYIFETEDLEKEEEVTNISEIEDMEEEEVANISETESIDEEEELANFSETESIDEEEELANIFEMQDTEELVTKSVLLMHWLKKFPVQKRANVSARTNIFEIEDSEEEEEVANISETEDMEEEELARRSESEEVEELTTNKMSCCCIC